MEALQVEFVTDPGAPAGWPRANRLSLRAVVALLALVLAGTIATLVRTGTVVEAGRPSAVLRCTCDPSPAAEPIQALFDEHLPGSVVVAEITQTVPGRDRVLQRRALRVVYGNVVITVVISPASSASPAVRDVGLTQNGYLIDFSFDGYYPPTLDQLIAVADDGRLLAVEP